MKTVYQSSRKKALLVLCNEIKDRPELLELYEEHYPNTHWVKIIDFNVLQENTAFKEAHLDTFVKLRLIEKHLHKLVVGQDLDLNKDSLITSIDGEPLSGLTFKLNAKNFNEDDYRERIKLYQNLINETEMQLYELQAENMADPALHGFWLLAAQENEPKQYNYREVLQHIDEFSATMLAKFKAQISVVEAINKLKVDVPGTTDDSVMLSYRTTSDSIVTIYLISTKIKPIMADILAPIAIDLYVYKDPKDSLYGFQYHIGISESRFMP